MPINHALVCALPDNAADAAAGKVVTTDWNADHTVTSLEITGGTVTTSTPLVDATQTWNDSGVTFTGLKLNVTDTASASASLLADFQVGGTSKAAISKDGRISSGYGYTYGKPQFYDHSIASDVGFQIKDTSTCVVYSAGQAVMSWGTNYTTGIRLSGGYSLGFVNGHAIQNTPDVCLWRDGAHQLAQRHSTGTNAQTFRVYGTYTDSSNYVRASLSASTTAITLAGETAGTGADDIDVNITPAGAGGVKVGAFFQEFAEMTAPSAPSANGVRIYAVDNGAGKTQLMALFSSGAAQQLAIQP